MIEEILGYRIRELRKSKNITQGALANDIGVSETTISKWENGNTVPDIEMLCILSDYFDLSLDELLDRDAELKKKVKGWKMQNVNKLSYSTKTELLAVIVSADDLLIQLVLKRLELEDVKNVIYGSSFTICERIISNLSLKVAGLVIDSMEIINPNEDEIIKSEMKFIKNIEDIRQRINK